MTDNIVLASRYEVVRHIGDGGMQKVFLAKDKLTKRDVALKTPLPGEAKNFADSARIAAKVNHHCVAKTYDYFLDAGNQYIIEEYVPGPNLEDAVPEGRWLDPHEGARLFLGAARGIAASHAVGVVHRDLKLSGAMQNWAGSDK
nr:protein kinase [uncultured Novosphingobium sp.]